MSDPRRELPPALVRELELMAVELAQLAGAEIRSALSSPFVVHYKDGVQEDGGYRNPVSEIDRATEVLVRARLAERFPAHDIIGEELDERPGFGADFVWAVDPVDGTANFINGFPLFSASIGLLYRGFPLVGAIWCSTTHVLQPGIYHARHGGLLCFDGRAVEPRVNPGVRRYLVGEPLGMHTRHMDWDSRQTGSAALECALAAAGVLKVTRLEGPRLWDCAGGVSLVQAAGGAVRIRKDGEWLPFECFEAPVSGDDPLADLRYWRGTLVMGEPAAVATYCGG